MTTANFRLRFFFDPGSGTCLWSGNDAASRKFHYPVDSRALPIPEEIAQLLAALVTEYDASFNFDDPSGESGWTSEQRTAFHSEGTRVLRLLTEALGPEYEVLDER